MTHVMVRDADYYLTGPHQGQPPDGKFPTGTKVKMLRGDPGYSQVESESGIRAWVATSDLKQL
jgi:hypothetical protein